MARARAPPGHDRWQAAAARHQQAGNRYLRKNLVDGARVVLPKLAERDTPIGRWLRDLLARQHKNVVVVPLANKLARICSAVLAGDRGFVEKAVEMH